MSNNKNDPNNILNNIDWASWIPIGVLFVIPYTWPIAIFLLIRKLTGAGKKRPSRHPYDIQREQQAYQAQQTYQAQQAPGQPTYTAQAASVKGAPSKKAAKKGSPFPKGKGLTIAGSIIAGIFGLGFLTEFFESLYWAIEWGWRELIWDIPDLAPLLGFFCLGLVLLGCGISRTRKGRRFSKYLSLIGRRDSVSIEALARAAGVSRHRLLSDLQDMLNSGVLPAGYLDMFRDQLVLSEEGIPDEAPASKEKAAPKEDAAPEQSKPQDDYAVLQEIRQVNDAIPDPVMSRKIDRIGEITGKILDYQRQHPGKDSQLRSFLSYYLPTTLKILRAYAQLDAQGVEGENISAAQARIEGMMDKVVEGFEKQLDKLFQDSAMDIASDVSVLEQMLEKDGLSDSGQGMTLGG